MSGEDIFETKGKILKRKKVSHLREQEIEKGLREIYRNPEIKSGEMSVFERGRGGRKWAVYGALFFFAILAVASWAGFFIFRPAEKFAGENIKLEIVAPEFLTSGQEEEIIINYKNGEEIPLGEVEITVAFPRDFFVISREPELPEGSNSWKMDSLSKNGEGSIKLRGRIDALKGKEMTFQAYFSYRPVNFNSNFQKVGSITVPIAATILSANIEGPERALDGEDIQYKIIYTNNSKKEIIGAEVRAEYADNFFVSKVEPATSEGIGRWILPKLSPGGKGEIKVSGSFSSGAEGVRETKVSIGVNDKEKGWLPFEESSSSISIVKSELKLLLVGNGQAKDTTVNFGDTLRYSLTFQNKSESTLSDIVITIRLNGLPVQGGRSPLLWNTFSDEAEGKKNIPTITWTKREVPKLGNLKAGEEDTIDFSLELMGAPFANHKSQDYKIEAFAEGDVSRVGGVKTSRTVRSESLVASLLSDLAFTSEARYFNDDDLAIGTGPVPPKIGEATTYHLWWKVKNSLHEVGKTTVGTTLPDGVSFTGKFSSSSGTLVSYDEKTRKVLWNIDKLPAETNEVFADFEVSITPAEDQLGNDVTLSDITNFEGRDLFLDALIFRTVAPLTTDLPNDPNLSGRGTVRR